MKFNEINNSYDRLDFRESFNESWLYESLLLELPQRLFQPDSLFNSLVEDIKECVKLYPEYIYDLSDGWFKYEGPQRLIFWFEIKNEIVIGGEFDRKPQSTIVVFVAKNSKYKGEKPYASDLYEYVLKDQNKSIGIESDKFLSDEGFDIWKRFLSSNHKINVYDKTKPGTTFDEIKTFDDLKKYFGDEKINQNYRYILSENNVTHFELKVLCFGRRKFQEENNLPLD